jgi:hypothetical protein
MIVRPFSSLRVATRMAWLEAFPSGMACAAFTSKFVKTWVSLPSLASTEAASP